MKVRLILTEFLLGTLAGQKEVAKTYIAGKHPTGEPVADEMEELEKMEEQLENASTIFSRDEKGIHLWDYQIKGFFKDACGMLRRVPDTRSSKLTSYKKVIDGLVFPGPRKIYIHHTGETSFVERPLRAQTAQGERIALARSETVPAGSYLDVDITCLDPKLEPLVIEWLDYGALRGLGQWRNSGAGRFEYERLDQSTETKKTKKKKV